MKKSVCLVIGCLLLLVVLVLTGCGTAATTTVAPTTNAPVVTSAAPTTSTAPKTTPPSNTAPAVTTAPAATTSAQKRGGTLVIQAAAGPQVFGVPSLMGTDSTSMGAAIPAIETLINFDNKGQAQPMLAESWKVDVSAKTITFSIRKGVKFHDGTDCDAAAVAWNLDQFIQAKSSTAANWLSVAVLDAYTVMLKLTEYKVTALAAFDGSAGMIISPTAYKLNGVEKSKYYPVGTGPFIIKNFVRDSVTEFVKNPNYWQPGKPYIDGLKYVVIMDSTAARMTFEAGQVDILTQAAGDTTKDLQAKGNKYDMRPGTISTLLFDSKNATSPFSKKAVREAVEYALDKSTMASSLGYGFWTPVTQAATEFQYGYNKDITGRPYDPAKAKQLLAEAGYPNGLVVTITTSSNYAADPVSAMQNYLNAAGFKCTVNTMTQAAWTTASTSGWNSLFYAPLGTTDAEYAAFLDRYYSASAVRYPVLLKPTAVTDLVNQVLYETDYTKRVALAQQAVKLMQEDCTSVHCYHAPALFPEKPYVMEAGYNNLGGSGFRWNAAGVWLNK